MVLIFKSKMFKAASLLFLLSVFPFQKPQAQSIDINGYVQSDKDVENIHVINKTAQLFTVTNSKGEFKIMASINDTLIFTSIQHKTQSFIIDEHVIASKTCIIKLEEFVNKLDEVTVGKILTGDLNMDVNNTEGDPPINFYDVGIPGYKGKIATQSERRLNAATTGSNGQKLKWYSPLTGQIPVDPIINAITGRTRMLKAQIEIEEKANLLHKIKTNIAKDFFIIYELDENLQTDFLYFCEEDAKFNLRCKNKSDIEIFEFLKEKLVEYKGNLNSNKN